VKLCSFFYRDKKRVYKLYLNKQNKIAKKKFSSVPFGSRIVFVPHCMRNSEACVAIENDSYYVCRECCGCKISKISKLIKKLKYRSLYIVKGSSVVGKIIKEKEPKAIIGIACFFEGNQVFKKILKKKDIATQFVPLMKDGCSGTDIDMKKMEDILYLTTD
jgi:hypothetical protein